MPRSSLSLGPFLLVAGTLLACGKPIELETDGDESGDQSTSSTTNGTTMVPTVPPTVDPDSTGDPPGPTERQVDILMVVDNSGSMGEEQGQMGIAIDALLDTLEGAAPPVDYRIGVTTTDNGNPWCQGTGPEAGSLVATSCRSRPTDFIFEGAQTIDATEEACYSFCPLENFAISDGKPWIEVVTSQGTANVPADQVRDAIRCMLPQGINGCGFESQLESTWKAVRRFETDNDTSFGFHRPGALLAILFVTDEADCSYNNEWETIFLPDGDRVFWSDPSAPAPSSAVCWNAGVACTGAGTYDCTSVNLDAQGNQVADANADDLAVLRPISRYIDYFAANNAFVAAINGVTSDGSVIYSDAPDPQFQQDFGIGPGCSSSAGEAVPPVRLRETVEAVSGSGNLHSICSGNFTGAFGAFANGILARLP